MDELVDAPGAYCLAKEGELYLVYLSAGTTGARIQLSQSDPFQVAWLVVVQ